MFIPSLSSSLSSVCFSLYIFIQLCYRFSAHVKENGFTVTKCSVEQRGLLVDLCVLLLCESLKYRVIEGLDAICLNLFWFFFVRLFVFLIAQWPYSPAVSPDYVFSLMAYKVLLSF